MKISKKLLLLVYIMPFYTIISMEISILQEEEKKALKALHLDLPKYRIYTNPTNYEEAYKEINKLIYIFKPNENNVGFSFLEILKKEYDSLNKQKALLMTKFDLSSSQKKLILQQEKTRLTDLEQQLVEKSKTVDQLIEKLKEDTKQVQDKSLQADGILNENREIKLQLQNMIQQNEQCVVQIKSINDSLNEVQQRKQALETEQLEFKKQLNELNENLQLKNEQKLIAKSFWQRREFYYGIVTGLGLLKLYSWFSRPSYSVYHKN